MVRKHTFDRKLSPRVAEQKDMTGIDYAIWVQNCELLDDALAELLDIEVKYVKRMRKLDWLPGSAVREKIDQLIMRWK